MTTDNLTIALTKFFGKRLRQNEPLAKHTTFRLGGPAKLWVSAQTNEELVQTVLLARQYHEPYLILGGAANILVSDAGFDGLVIHNRTSEVVFPTVSAETPYGTPVRLLADGGVILPNLAKRCAKRGLSGFEWAVGVPGTIGGAVVNNAGAYNSDMGHDLIRAELLSPQGERVWQPNDWFQYAYRHSRLKAQQLPWVILRAELQMKTAPEETITERMQTINTHRKTSQPPGATIGSMFKNPPNDYAGRLIEAAGLKGYRAGQAQISPLHANFFQNLGGATADDVLYLIQTARETVKIKFGVELQLEIEVIGDG